MLKQKVRIQTQRKMILEAIMNVHLCLGKYLFLKSQVLKSLPEYSDHSLSYIVIFIILLVIIC